MTVYWLAALRKSIVEYWPKRVKHYLQKVSRSSFPMVGNIIQNSGKVQSWCMNFVSSQHSKNIMKSMWLATIRLCHNWTSRNSESSSLSHTLPVPPCSSTSSLSTVAKDGTYINNCRAHAFFIRFALSKSRPHPHSLDYRYLSSRGRRYLSPG